MLLGTTEIVPDFTTIWRFRERLAEKGVDQKIWAEMQRQLDAMNLKMQKGVMQDATFITTDPGYAKADTSSYVMKLIYHDIWCYAFYKSLFFRGAARCLALAREELGALRRCAGLPRSLSSRGPYMQHGIYRADGLHELPSPGRVDLGQRSRGHGTSSTW